MSTDSALVRRLRELEWLYASLQAVTGTLDLAEMLRAVLDAMKRMVSAEALSLLLYDPARDELVFAASETLGEETLAGPVPAAIGRETGLDDKRLAVALRRDGCGSACSSSQRRDGRAFDEADRARAEAVAAGAGDDSSIRPWSHDVEALYRVSAQ
jgi:hypothetical protein